MIDNPNGPIVMPASTAALFDEWERRGSIRRVQPSSVRVKEIVVQPMSGPVDLVLVFPHHVVKTTGVDDECESRTVLPDQGESPSP